MEERISGRRLDERGEVSKIQVQVWPDERGTGLGAEAGAK